MQVKKSHESNMLFNVKFLGQLTVIRLKYAQLNHRNAPSRIELLIPAPVGLPHVLFPVPRYFPAPTPAQNTSWFGLGWVAKLRLL